jgi:cell volume regulation protein A
MDLANELIFVAGMLFLVSILATAFTPRLGVPLLLVFLVVGMLAGENGPGGIHFDDFRVTSIAAITALAVILLDGGMRTPIENFRVGLRPALALSTFGVLATTAIVGVAAAHLLKLSLAQGLLVGAIVGSTDAAAVFSLLHTRSVHLNQRINAVLEIESGTNDPTAILLTLCLIDYLQAPDRFTALSAIMFFARQFGIGIGLGWSGGRLLSVALSRLELSDSLYPLLALSGGMLVFGTTALLGGSGFVAIYITGLVLGNSPLRASGAIRRFHDGIAWMAQIGMFVILGLLAVPSRLIDIALPALEIALVLIFIARPVSVLLSLLPFRMPWREQAFVAWVGLRGSVPMVLATFPVMAGLEHAEVFFDIAFFIVLVSLVVQGWTVPAAGRILGLQMPSASTLVRRIEIDLPGSSGHEVVSYRVSRSSAVVGRSAKELPIREISRIVSVSREGRVLPYREWGRFAPGDYISLLASRDDLPQLDEVFRRIAPQQSRAEREYFGEFVIDPAAKARDLAEAYGATLPDEVLDKTMAEVFASTMNLPVVGDRLRLGGVEVVVRRMEGRQVAELGLRLPGQQES